MKYLIAGLGNIGDEYADTRHNIGFRILDCLAAEENIIFADRRYGYVGEYKYKGRTLALLRPFTYMNASGEAVRYWLQKEKILVDHLLVLVDDIALPFGAIRLKGKGSDGGHNGLKSINAMLGTTEYARLRFGIGNSFASGRQIDYVLGKWTPEEEQILPDRLRSALEVIKSYVTIGTERTMNFFNNK
ncbi:MAG: aminoacyl-tRNA hydrolase [Bacteroidales bacterium]|nr:aminoacyl-tRNA hydrolase [Bacteroidales bacterium]